MVGRFDPLDARRAQQEGLPRRTSSLLTSSQSSRWYDCGWGPEGAILTPIGTAAGDVEARQFEAAALGLSRRYRGSTRGLALAGVAQAPPT